MSSSCKTCLIVCSILCFGIVFSVTHNEFIHWVCQFQNMHPLPFYLIIGMGVIAIALFSYVIYLIDKQNKILNLLNNKIQNLKSSSQISIEGSNIKLIFKIIAYIGLFFCLFVAIHYMAFELPRLINKDAVNSHINNLGVDYLGLIVAIFAILVTLLVGWQIYSTIKVKEELEKSKENIKERFKDKFKEFEDCCKKRGEDIELLKTDTNKKIDAQSENIEKSERDLALYTESLAHYSVASLQRLSFLMLENNNLTFQRLENKLQNLDADINFKITKPLSTNLLDECFNNIGTALMLSNQSSIKDGIVPICKELLILTSNILNRNKTIGIIKPITIGHIDKVHNQVVRISSVEFKNISEIIINLKEIRNLRLRYENE